jgi:hypothetical protein
MRPYINRLREIFRYQSYEQLERLAGKIPVGSAQRFGLPGGRELDLNPTAVRSQSVRMIIRTFYRGAQETRTEADLPAGRPYMHGGPPYGGGVLIIVITAYPE